MNHTYSQAEQALRDMLIHKAQGTAHDAIAELMSLPRPYGFREEDWVNAIHTIAFGARGHPRAVFRFLEMALMRWHRRRPVEVKTAFPTRLYRGVGAAFDDTYLGRLVRIGGMVYDGDDLNPGMTGRLYAIEGTRHAGGDYVDLVPIKTSENAAPVTPDADEDRHATFLCFRIREAQSGPQLYAFHDEEHRETRVGKYDGTQCLYEVLLDPTRFAPHPPTFLQDDTASGRVALTVSGTNIGFSGAHPFVDDQPVRVHATVSMPVPLMEGVTYYVVNKTLLGIELSLTVGGAAIPFSTAGTGRISVTPVTTVPLGGHLTPNAAYSASRGKAGAPWPLYLSNGRRLARLEPVLEDVLAAGVRIEIKLDRY